MSLVQFFLLSVGVFIQYGVYIYPIARVCQYTW